MNEEPSAPRESPSGDGSNDALATMGFLDHLEELRTRLIRALIYLIGGTVICLFFAGPIIQFLTVPFDAGADARLALLHPTEGFTVRLKVAFVAGLFLTCPFWFWQLWRFISPGLYLTEKRVIVPVMIASSLVFLMGAGFGYWMLPHAVHYFQSLTTPDVAVSWSLARYIDFAVRLLIAFGLIFELPLVIYATALMGMITPATLRKYRRHAIVGILVVAAIITPPDAFTMVLLSAPLVILYEIGIFMAAVATKRRRL